jgi:hypothetical protein
MNRQTKDEISLTVPSSLRPLCAALAAALAALPATLYAETATLSEVVVSAPSLEDAPGATTLPDEDPRHAARGHQRFRQPAAQRPGREPVHGRRRVQPAVDPRTGRRPAAHQGRRHGSGLRLRQPHESAALVHRSDPRGPRAGVHQPRAREPRWRQHRRRDPGGLAGTGVRRARHGRADPGRGRRVLPQQRRCARRQSQRDHRR